MAPSISAPHLPTVRRFGKESDIFTANPLQPMDRDCDLDGTEQHGLSGRLPGNLRMGSASTDKWCTKTPEEDERIREGGQL